MSGLPSGKRVLVIEDDRTLNQLIRRQLEQTGYSVTSAYSWREGEKTLQEREPAVTILDIRLPDGDGLSLLPGLSEQCPVIVLTAFGSIDQAVQAIKAGAADYLTKPVSPDELELAIGRALENRSLRRDYQFYRDQLLPGTADLMVGESAALTEVLRHVELVAGTDTTVLIQGESGVGKELVAQAIHQRSPRAGANFVAVDCCTLQESLFESELFGHERGAFTGADRRKQGLIEVAEGGTVLLDEIGEIPPSLQAKLLRVLETGQFRRLGGTKDLDSDVRFVAATNRDLHARCQDGGFRLDLYYRLAAFVITVPPLRERTGDIGLLASYFLRSRKFLRRADKRLSPEALAALRRYPWPGNVRELKNVVERAILMSGDDPEIRPAHLGLGSAEPAPTTRVQLTFEAYPTLEEVRQAYIARLFEDYGGHRARIADVLGVSERNLYRLIKRDGLKEHTSARNDN